MTEATKTDTVTLTIDGKSVTVPKGTVVVDAAKTVDIEIPVFCYHEKLGPFGCCRMCLVEVEKMPKLTTACTLAVGQDMVVNTKSDKVVKAQQGVLEFTLLNHPLDCPVCDKGGECPLQDNTFKFGPPDTRMEYDRHNRDKATPLSPVITIDRERCIACQRCTRYSDIIEKEQALVMLNRGFKNKVATFNEEDYDTRFSGNVIDICPVGALTNTDFRFSARSWDLTNTKTTCGNCGVNCNMTLGARVNELKRITTEPNDFVDDGWICDKGRWGHQFTKSKNRITAARKKGSDQPLSVKDAAVEVAEKLKAVVDEHGPASVGFIGSPFALNEELYLYQKLFRSVLGSNNLDHKNYQDTPGLPVPNFDLQDVETSDLILLIASDPSEELPILELRIKKAVTQKDKSLAVLNDQATSMDRFASLSLRYNIGSDGSALDALNLALEGQTPPGDLETKTGLSSDNIQNLVEKIKEANKVSVVYNPAAMTPGSVHITKQLLTTIGNLSGKNVGALPSAPATNALGAMDMGIVPDFYPGGLALSDAEKIKELYGENAPVEAGLSVNEMIAKARSGEIKALVVYRSNPVLECPGPVADALIKLDLLVVHEMLETETADLAHYVLPSNGPGLDEGTTTNIGGRVQHRKRGIMTDNPQDVKILGHMLKALGDETLYKDVFAVTKEISEKVPGYGNVSKKSLRGGGVNREGIASQASGAVSSNDASSGEGLSLRIAHCLFRHDKILDAESPLAHQFSEAVVHLNPNDASSLGIKDGEEVTVSANGAELRAAAVVSGRCNAGGVVLPWVSDEQGVMSLVGDTPTTTVKVSK